MIVLLMVVAMGVLIFPFLALDARKEHKIFVQRRKAGEWMTVEEENFGMRQKGNEFLFTVLFFVSLCISGVILLMLLQP